MTTDTKHLRELLEKATPGPWTQGTSKEGRSCVWTAGAKEPVHGMGADMEWIDCNTDEAAAYIAAANPATMAALLDELDALRFQISEFREDGSAAVRFAPSSAHWSNELRRLFGEDARQGIDSLEARLRKADSALESKEAEVQRLERACRVAVIALEHATQQEHGKIYEPAYQAVSDALYPVAALSGHTTNEGA